MPPSQRIKIFWDLVTCPIPTSYTSLGEVIRDIRLFTNKFGVVTSIKAYWDRNKTQPADDPLRAAMPSMGVNLVDCSTMQGYTNDALAKLLSVDLVISAMDDPINQETREDGIIMVISGDKSILYSLSLLMLRNYTVYLVVPNDDTESFQATRVFSWYRDTLGCGPSHSRVSALATEPLKPPGWVVNGIHIPQQNWSNPPVARPPTNNQVFPRSIQPSSQMSSPKPMTSVTSPPTTPKSKENSIPPSEPLTWRALSALSLNSDQRGPVSKSLATTENPLSGDYAKGISSASDPPGTRPPVALQNDNTVDWAAIGCDPDNGWETVGSKSKRSSVPEPDADVEIQAPFDPPLSVFEPLVAILEESGSMMWSQLGEQLAKRKGLYQSAGVAGFTEFMSLATQKRIVSLRGSDNRRRVKLRKR